MTKNEIGISKGSLIRLNVFIQICKELGLLAELETFLTTLAENPSAAVSQVKSIVESLSQPSLIAEKVRVMREKRGVVFVSDVDATLKHATSFKVAVKTLVNEKGLSNVARQVGMNPANLAASLKADHSLRYETIRRIAVALGLVEFKIRSSDSGLKLKSNRTVKGRKNA